MRSMLAFALLGVVLSGCAENRILQQSEVFSADISSLPTKEVLHNLSLSIDNPYHIPSRTTFGSGKLSFTDNNMLNVTTPIHNIARNSGSASATLGQFIDGYELAVAPEADAVTLRKLRNLYRSVVCPSCRGEAPERRHPGGRWLYWKNIDGEQSPDDVPPIEARSVGVYGRHELWITSQQRLSDFVLETLGAYETPLASSQRPAKTAAKGGEKREPGSRGEAKGFVPERGASPPGGGIPQRVPPQDILSSPPTQLLIR